MQNVTITSGLPFQSSNILFLALCLSLAQFEKGVAEGTVDPAFNPVVAVRLTVQKDSAVWAIISEVCLLPLV